MENAICVPRFDEAALGSGEDQPRLAPARAGGKPLLELSLAVCPQNGHQWVRYGQHRDRCVGLHRAAVRIFVVLVPAADTVGLCAISARSSACCA
jgi:hypothetical protein